MCLETFYQNAQAVSYIDCQGSAPTFCPVTEKYSTDVKLESGTTTQSGAMWDGWRNVLASTAPKRFNFGTFFSGGHDERDEILIGKQYIESMCTRYSCPCASMKQITFAKLHSHQLSYPCTKHPFGWSRALP